MCLPCCSTAEDVKNRVLRAAQKGNGITLLNLCSGWRKSPNLEIDENSATPLHITARHVHLEAMGALLGIGALPNCLDKRGKTPLHYLVTTEDLWKNGRDKWISAAKLLIMRGADCTIRDKQGDTPLDLVVRSLLLPAEEEMAEYLASVQLSPEKRSSFLVTAIEQVDDITFAFFLFNKLPRHTQLQQKLCDRLLIKDSETYLYERTRNQESIEKLLDYGANPNTKDENGNTLLHHISRYGMSPDIAALLLSRKANPNAVNNQGQTPLHTNINGPTAIVKELIRNGANCNLRDKEGNAPLHAVDPWKVRFSTSTSIKNIQLLIEQNADISLQNHAKQTPLDKIRQESRRTYPICEELPNDDYHHYDIPDVIGLYEETATGSEELIAYLEKELRSREVSQSSHLPPDLVRIVLQYDTCLSGNDDRKMPT